MSGPSNSDKQKAYEYLRALLNSAIRGPNTDALLKAIASAHAYHIFSLESVAENLYISRASEQYLDAKLSDFGITRDPRVGLGDDVFRGIGISIKNRKQVRDLVNNLLSVIFGEDLNQAYVDSIGLEPFSLNDGDDLWIKFDGSEEVIKIKFFASQFSNINAATAQEVASAITRELKKRGYSGKAIAKDTGSGFCVSLFSETKGPSSMIAVVGGKAQNALVFPSPRPTTNGPSTVWQFFPLGNGNVRFSWIGGANPSIGKIKAGDYANLFAPSFLPQNRGTFYVTKVQGGSMPGSAYIEFYNPLAVSQAATQGTIDGALFFYPKEIIGQSKPRYTALFQTESNTLELFIPATTKVVRRDRRGAAHIHEPILYSYSETEGIGAVYSITVPAPSAINDGDYFLITGKNTGNQYYVYFDTTGSNIVDPMATPHPVRINIAGMTAAWQVGQALSFALNNTDFTSLTVNSPTIKVAQTKVGVVASPTNVNVSGLNIVIEQAGMDGTVTSSSAPNPIELIPEQEGPYSYLLSQPYTISDKNTTITNTVEIGDTGLVQGVNFSNFPQEGYVVLNYGMENEEGPVPYIGVPANNLISIAPNYFFKNKHLSGSSIRFIEKIGPHMPDKIGRDYAFYLTDIIAGRLYAIDLIKSILATGIRVIIHILYPNDIGLGEWGTENSEKVIVWGPDDIEE